MNWMEPKKGGCSQAQPSANLARVDACYTPVYIPLPARWISAHKALRKDTRRRNMRHTRARVRERGRRKGVYMQRCGCRGANKRLGAKPSAARSYSVPAICFRAGVRKPSRMDGRGGSEKYSRSHREKERGRRATGAESPYSRGS